MNKAALKKQERAAIDLARRIHRGEVDLNGEPHILHVFRVAAMFEGRDRIVALLHDVIESGYTAEQLHADGYAPTIVLAVELLSRVPGEPYSDYLLRLQLAGGAAGRVGRRVKRGDATDNLARSKRDGRASLIARYESVLAAL